MSDAILATSPKDRLVGTWVRYSESKNDTLRFSDDGIFVYTLGDYPSEGHLYIDQYFYECTDHYLINYNNVDVLDYTPQIHYIEFSADNTYLLLDLFTFYPGFQVDMIYSVLFKKID